MKNINELTEDCLIWLFGQFSLQELIELRKVCQLWTVIIEQICQRKKSLKLFRNLQTISTYSDHLLAFKLQTDSMLLLKPVGNDDELIGCNWNEVSGLFTNVQHLVYYDLSDQLDEVLQAMPNITNLTLSGFEEEFQYFSKIDIEKCAKSLKSLNRLASLKQLHLDGYFIHGRFYTWMEDKFPDIEILSNLESFYLINFYWDIFPTINQFGENLRKLSLNVAFDKLEQMFKIKPEIFTKLIYFNIRAHGFTDITEKKKLFHFICENFQSLETFEFGSTSSFTQDETIFSLAKLKNLTDLSVEEVWDVENSLLTDKLEQINKFEVKFNGFDQKTFPRLAVRSIFPNLESIIILARDEDLLSSAKIYLVEEQKLTCKVNCDIINADSLIYMGRYRKHYEIEEERRRFQDEENEKQWLQDKYDDYDPYDRYEKRTSSEESYILRYFSI